MPTPATIIGYCVCELVLLATFGNGPAGPGAPAGPVLPIPTLYSTMSRISPTVAGDARNIELPLFAVYSESFKRIPFKYTSI